MTTFQEAVFWAMLPKPTANDIETAIQAVEKLGGNAAVLAALNDLRELPGTWARERVERAAWAADLAAEAAVRAEVAAFEAAQAARKRTLRYKVQRLAMRVRATRTLLLLRWQQRNDVWREDE